MTGRYNPQGSYIDYLPLWSPQFDAVDLATWAGMGLGTAEQQFDFCNIRGDPKILPLDSHMQPPRASIKAEK